MLIFITLPRTSHVFHSIHSRCVFSLHKYKLAAKTISLLIFVMPIKKFQTKHEKIKCQFMIQIEYLHACMRFSFKSCKLPQYSAYLRNKTEPDQVRTGNMFPACSSSAFSIYYSKVKNSPSANLFSSSVFPMALAAWHICLRSSSKRRIHLITLPTERNMFHIKIHPLDNYDTSNFLAWVFASDL